MNHLSDEQLSALLDDQLPAADRTAADAHLAGCEACRVRLADLSALDQSLGKALAHDPGESYFAGFADRVASRIATGDARPLDAAPEAPKARKFWNWLVTPRGLALAGSTAALLVTAGIAWMRFGGDVAYAPRPVLVGSSPVAPKAPSAYLQQAPTGENDGAQPQEQSPPAASAPATPPTEDWTPSNTTTRSYAVSPGERTARAQQLKTLPNGEQVPVDQARGEAGAPAREKAQGNALAAPATGSAIAQIKRRSIAPAAEATAPAPGAAASLSKEEAGAKQDAKKDARPATEAQLSTRDAAPTPAPAPKPAAAAPPATPQLNAFSSDTARGQSFHEWSGSKSLKAPRVDEVTVSTKLPSLAANCGKVRDSRGRELAGAQVTAVRNGVRTARTGPDGSFCIDGLKPGDTLTVMHVGFDPWTVVMTPMTSLAITLEPVGTLGPNSTMLTGKAQAPSPPQSLSGALRASAPPADSAPRPDVYADQSNGVRQLVRDAREATAIARRERTAPSFENAAKRWAAVLGQVKGAPAHDAGFQYVAALREAYQLEPTSERGGRLRSAMAAFLATAPATLPERATVARWQSELNVPADR